jgi:signal transduction histidine kinase
MRGVLADVSHDLRTPIAGVIAVAEQLLRTDPPRVEREQRLVDLIRESRRAARLVDDLLLMARLDASTGPELPPSIVDVAAVVAGAVAVARSARADRTITLTVDPASATRVEIDPDRLTRVLTNLLDNARNATLPGGRIDVSVTTRGPDVQITVADDGPGVSRGDQERIFDRLVRLDPARRSGGSGLGLPIARAVARTAHGDVRYVGSDGRGACFEVRLPIAALAFEAPPTKIIAELAAVV